MFIFGKNNEKNKNWHLYKLSDYSLKQYKNIHLRHIAYK